MGATGHGPGSPARFNLATQVAQNPGQQPGDLHLGHPDVTTDLLLCPALHEPQVQDPLVPRFKTTHERAPARPSPRRRTVRRPSRAASRPSSPFRRRRSPPDGRSREEGTKQPSADMASMTSEISSPRWAASLRRLGRAAERCTSSASARTMRGWAFWMRRGGRIVQPWSRKYFFSSRGYSVPHMRGSRCATQAETGGRPRQGGVGDLGQVLTIDAATSIPASDFTRHVHVDAHRVVEQGLAAITLRDRRPWRRPGQYGRDVLPVSARVARSGWVVSSGSSRATAGRSGGSRAANTCL